MTATFRWGASREERVRALLRAARRMADPKDALGIEARRALPSSTGLSVAGVELGLTHHLETDVTDADLAAFVARAGTAPRVHVVLSANVFVGALRALALAVAASPRVTVRPSRREGVLAPLLVRGLDEEGVEHDMELVAALAAEPGDHVHLYGRRETIDEVRKSLAPGVVLRAHGPGFGVAVVDATASDVKAVAEGLSWDVTAFDQRGCLSPRVVFAEGSTADVDGFAAALAAELEARERDVPRGALDEDERRDAALYEQTLSAVGQCHRGSAFAVGVDPHPRAVVLPPSGRHVHIAHVASPDIAQSLLAPCRASVTCVGKARTGALSREVIALLPTARVAYVGQMQRPPLDGPVDLREVI